jgi:fructose-1,6-bisphosphatase, class II
MERELALEVVRVTEAAAIESGRWVGKGNKIAADQAAVDAMRGAFDSVHISGKVVIGEGEMDEAPMLYIGEEVGAGGQEVDIAVDPLEGTNLTAKGMSGAIAVLAMSNHGGLLHAPDMYMMKLVVGPQAAGKVHLDAPVGDNLRIVAESLKRRVEDVTVVVLDRPRHEQIIQDIRKAGARIHLITDGDVSPAVSVGIDGTGIHMMIGSGGAPEGVIAAAALKCLGGEMQARLVPENDEEIARMKSMGIADPNKILTMADLVPGEDAFFAATGVTQSNLLNEVRYFGGGTRTHSIVMRAKTGTVRFVDAIHTFDRKQIPVIRRA